jgi:hypothetical protein
VKHGAIGAVGLHFQIPGLHGARFGSYMLCSLGSLMCCFCCHTGNLSKPQLARGELRCFGATNPFPLPPFVSHLYSQVEEEK